LKLQNLLHEILAIIGIFSSFFLAATGDVGLRVQGLGFYGLGHILVSRMIKDLGGIRCVPY
jgi:hypothetical protein